MRRLIPLIVLAVVSLQAQAPQAPTLYPPGPDTQVQPNTPKGTVTRGVLPVSGSNTTRARRTATRSMCPRSTTPGEADAVS